MASRVQVPMRNFSQRVLSTEERLFKASDGGTPPSCLWSAVALLADPLWRLNGR